MRKLVLIIVLLFTPEFLIGYGFETNYDVEGIYTKTSLPFGSKVLSKYGSIEDASFVLTPTKIADGIYKIRLKKLSSGIYEIVGKKIVLEVKSSYSILYKNEYKLDYGESLLDLSSNSFSYGTLGVLVTSD